jgi:hypothetical protein
VTLLQIQARGGALSPNQVLWDSVQVDVPVLLATIEQMLKDLD